MGINGGVSRTNDADIKQTSDGTQVVKMEEPFNEYGQLDAGQQIVVMRLEELIELQKGLMRMAADAWDVPLPEGLGDL